MLGQNSRLQVQSPVVGHCFIIVHAWFPEGAGCRYRAFTGSDGVAVLQAVGYVTFIIFVVIVFVMCPWLIDV